MNSPSAPSNVRYAWKESAIRVTWDAVENADYYNAYYDDTFDSDCAVGMVENPIFCEE